MLNKRNGYRYIKAFRVKCKMALIKAFGGKCGICGYSRCNEALDFHHLNPNDKEFNISSWRNLNWKKVLKEAKKCVMLCVRCHKEIHSGITKIPNNITRLNEKEMENTFKKIKKIMPRDSCKCGNEKPANRLYCSQKCSYKYARPDWNKWNLKKMIIDESLSLTKVADIIGVTRTTISTQCKKQNINYKK